MATTLTLTRITGPVETPLGLLPENGRIQFLLSHADSEGGTVVAPVTVEASLDAEGDFDADLWCPTEGTVGASYEVRASWWDGTRNMRVWVTLGWIAPAYNASPQSLPDLLTPAAPTPTPTDLLASITAFAAAADADAAAAAASAAAAAASAALALAGSPYRFDTFADLASRVKYSGATGDQINAVAGDVFTIAGLPEAFVVVASGATTYAMDYTGSGGVKFTRASDVWYYVNAATGSDSNDGLSLAAAKQTLGAIPRMDGLRLRLVVSATDWRESLDLSLYKGCVVEGFGDFVAAGGTLPRVRGDDTITGPWDDSAARADANTNVYSISWTHSITINAGLNLVPWVFEDDFDMVMATSLANCQATPGTFWHLQPVTGAPVTIYVHPTGSGNPASNGKTYSATRRHEVLRIGDKSTLRNLWGHAAGNTLGAIVHGDDCVIENMLGTGCPIHTINGGANFTRRRCVAVHHTKPPSNNIIAIESFTDDGRMGVARHEHCHAIGPATMGTDDVVGFGGHNTTGGRDWLRVEYHDCASVNCTMDVTDAWFGVYRRCAIWNGSILGGARSDGGAVTLDIEDLQVIAATKATRGYVIQQVQMGLTGDMAEANVNGLRCYFNFSGSSDAVFVQPGNLRLTNSVIVLGAGSVGSDGVMRMDSATTRMNASVSHCILVGQVGGLLWDLRNTHLNGSTFKSDLNCISPLVTNNTNSTGYRSQVAGAMTTRYTLADIRSSFGTELYSVSTAPALIDPANGDFRPSVDIAIPGIGPERPGVRFPKKLTTRAAAMDWLVYGEMI